MTMGSKTSASEVFKDTEFGPISVEGEVVWLRVRVRRAQLRTLRNLALASDLLGLPRVQVEFAI